MTEPDANAPQHSGATAEGGEMTVQDFADLVDRHGAAPEQWPATLRAAAGGLLAASASARQLLADAERLARGLDRVLRAVPAPLGLATRIVANAPRRDAWLDWLGVKLWRPAALACLPLVCGFVAGMGFIDDTTDLEDMALVAFADSSVLDFATEAEDE